MIPNYEQFMKDFKLDCPAAKHRIKIGIPEGETSMGATNFKNMKVISDTTANLINARDALELNFKSIDKLQPLISAIVQSLSKCPVKDFQEKQKLKDWLILFNKMKASEQLDDEQIRQLGFDLDSTLEAFNRQLDSLS